MVIYFLRNMKKVQICFIFIITLIFTITYLTTYRDGQITSLGSVQDIASVYQQNESTLTAITPPLLWKYRTEGTVTSSPALADVDGNGELDIIFGSGDSKLYAANGKTGALLWTFQTGGVIDSSPAIGDLDGDGTPDVLIGASSGRNCYLYAIIGENGSLLWKYKISDGLDLSSPVVSDLDGDGKLEVAFGITARDPNFFVLNGEDGSVLWEFSTKISLLGTSPAVGDLNGDGKLNIAFQSEFNPTFGSEIYMLDGLTGSLLWTRNMTENVDMSSPSLYDINNDGKLDIIVGSGDDHMYALNGEDGAVIWKYKTPGNIWSSPALGDIDLDGQVEVIFGSTHGEKVYALDGEDGSLRWAYKTPHAGGYSSPALGDLDGDNRLDVVVGRWDGKLHAINGDDGSGLWTYQTAGGVVSSPALGDVDGDGALEIVVGSEDGWLYVIDPPSAGQRIYWQGYGGTLAFDRTSNLLDVDRDQDFLSDYSEGLLGTNSSDPDSDDDGLPDGWEIGYSFDPLNTTDALLDSDGDGLTNLEEYTLNLNPMDPDVDNDGALDGEEVNEFLLDPKNPWLNPLTRLLIVLYMLSLVLTGLPATGAFLYYYFHKQKQKKVKELDHKTFNNPEN
jgi:outer membrane protein assembly factor BamB